MIRKNIDLLNFISNLKEEEHLYFIEENCTSKTIIAQQDTRTKWVYIIKQGIAKCSLNDDNGNEFIQEFFSEGMKFGELEVFNNKAIYCAMIAITNVVYYKISHENFTALLNSNKTFNTIVLKSLVTKLSEKGPRFAFQQNRTIKDNIFKLFQEFPTVLNIIPKQDIANYLGITLRSLNRSLNDLQIVKPETE